MQIQIFTAVLAFAMGISAAAWKPTANSYAQKCGNTGKLSCCNTQEGSAAAGGLLGAAGLDGLMGGSCAQIPTAALTAALGGTGDICGGNTVSCCSQTSTQQVGLINLSTTCSPLQL